MKCDLSNIYVLINYYSHGPNVFFSKSFLQFLLGVGRAIWVSVWVCVCPCACGYLQMPAEYALKLKLELEVVFSHTIQVLGTKHRFFIRATSALNFESFLLPHQNALFFPQRICFHSLAKASLRITQMLPQHLCGTPKLRNTAFS